MIYRRQRLLLGLIDFLNTCKRLDRLTLIKSMFLISKNIPLKFAHYHFHPYKFGPYSAKLYQDLAILENSNLITSNKFEKNLFENISTKSHKESSIKLTESGKMELYFPLEVKMYMENVLENFSSLERLIDYIYREYPEYTCISERKYIPKPFERGNEPGFFLIGYEGKDIDEFLNELIVNHIQILVDIRASPRSMKFDFSGSRIQKFIEKVGIHYIHIPELGIENEERKNLYSKSDYELLFKKYRKELKNKEEYLEKVIKLGKRKRIALMCFERDPNYCHRGQVGEILKKRNFQVISI